MTVDITALTQITQQNLVNLDLKPVRLLLRPKVQCRQLTTIFSTYRGGGEKYRYVYGGV